MASVTGLTTTKRFTYRGDSSEEFSNTYHFKNAPPTSDALWDALATSVWNCEKMIFPNVVSLVQVYGYDSDDPHAHHVYAKDYTIPGPPPTGAMGITGNPFAGDQAACVQWKTNRLNSRGKSVYLRKYVHRGNVSTGNADNLDATYLTALNNFAGSGAVGIQAVGGGLRSRDHDETILAAGAIPFVTTRTLKRRGKRPLPGTRISSA